MNHIIDRRSFFKVAGVGTAAAALAAWGCGTAATEQAQTVTDAESQASVAGAGAASFSASCDVLVVGSGIAGLSAAMAPSEAGLKVIVVDKDTLLGGESYASSGMLQTYGTHLQEDAGVTKTADDWWAQRQNLLASRYPDAEMPPQVLLESICRFGATWIDQVAESYGASFMDPAEYLQAGVPDCVIIPKSGLESLDDVMNPLRDQLAAQGVDFMADQTLEAFVADEAGAICGVRLFSPGSGASTDVQASAVVLATGSCTTNQKVFADNLPALLQVGSYGYLADGAALQVAQRFGAADQNLDAMPDLIGDVAAVDAWGCFAPVVAVGPSGKRFAREDDRFSCPNACFEHDLGFWWTIFDQQMGEGAQSSNAAKTLEKFGDRHVGPFDTVEGLAQACDLPADALKATLQAWNKAADAGKDDDFGRTGQLKKLAAPYHAVKQKPIRFRTVGGLRVNETLQAVDGLGAPVANLYACGSCAAIMSTGFLDNAASGLLAGQAIATALLQEEPAQ